MIIIIVRLADSNYNIVSDFYPLDVVGRGSDTQLQVSENLNCVEITR